jgi:hemerythrin
MSYQPLDPSTIVLGVPDLDAEHREQLAWMNRLGAAIAAGAEPAEIADDLEALIGYLEAHFMSEQILMREEAYPAFQSHDREHDEAVALLRKILESHAAGDVNAMQALLQALTGWLVAHIHTSDRALATYVAARGLEMP